MYYTRTHGEENQPRAAVLAPVNRDYRRRITRPTLRHFGRSSTLVRELYRNPYTGHTHSYTRTHKYYRINIYIYTYNTSRVFI